MHIGVLPTHIQTTGLEEGIDPLVVSRRVGARNRHSGSSGRAASPANHGAIFR